MGATLRPNFCTHSKPAQDNFFYPLTDKIKISKQIIIWLRDSLAITSGLHYDLVQEIVFSKLLTD